MPAPTTATSSATRWNRSTKLDRAHPRHPRGGRDPRLRRRRGRARGARRAGACASCACVGSPGPACRALDDLAGALRANPATQRAAGRRGRCRCARSRAPTQPMPRSYVWPYQMHASIGPSCALADWQPTTSRHRMRVWAGSQNPHVLRADLAQADGPSDDWRSTWCAWKRPAATAATAPTTWRPTPRCWRARSARRCGCSSRASRSTPGSPRARRS